LHPFHFNGGTRKGEANIAYRMMPIAAHRISLITSTDPKLTLGPRMAVTRSSVRRNPMYRTRAGRQKKYGCMAESVGQNGTPGGTDSQGHERLLCQNAAPGGPENEFFALARGLQRHPGRWGSGDHMFECVSAHFRP
jgi:hypothetical protein